MGALEGKVAAVTGASSGSGRAIATRFAAEGAAVCLLAREPSRLAELEQELGGDTIAISCDVGDPASVRAAFGQIAERFGKLDILVNNAAVYRPCPVEHISDDDIQRQLATNLAGPILTSRSAIPLLRAAGGGSIVNMASASGLRPTRGESPYAAAKAGVINFTKTAALELAPHRIRVNALAPDITVTEGMAAVAPPGAEARFGLTVPLGRPGHVDEMGGAAVFLAGDLSSYVTGETIHVDGGTHAASGWYHHPDTGAYILGPT